MLEAQKVRVDELLEEFKRLHGGENFEFRKYQKEAILGAIDAFLGQETKHYFLEAPTGSGKSIIGIVTAYVLNGMGYTGYILASDLNLQTQYENDFRRLKLDWGSVRGIDNYICTENGERHSIGNCHVRCESSDKIKKRKCYIDCPYFSARARAMASPTSLLNYSYWLIQRNYCAEQHNMTLFGKRDFIICDEAHKLVDIVQNHFAPCLSLAHVKNLEFLCEGLKEENLWNLGPDAPDWKSLIYDAVNERDKEALIQKVFKVVDYLVDLQVACTEFKRKVSGKIGMDGVIPKSLKKMAPKIDWLKDVNCKFEDCGKIINEVGMDMIIPCYDESIGSVTLKTLDEKYLMENFFHNEHNFSLMMTATMGSAKLFYEQIKGSTVYNAKSCKIPSTFNFDKSPIYSYRGHSMSYKQKDKNIGWIIEKVDEILDKHKGEKGIIHCGSYALGQAIMNGLKNKKRLVIYKPGEKEMSLAYFNQSKDKVLMGPSILEGVNLDGEKSRFQIFVKVPYASLGDNFVKAKLEHDKEWYQRDAVMKILQGVGRSVRFDGDYATTYILDGDFVRLWRTNKEQFSKEFNSRLLFM